MDVAALADLLHETAEHHDPYEKSHPTAQLVGLVRTVHARSPAGQHAGAGFRRGGTLHGGTGQWSSQVRFAR